MVRCPSRTEKRILVLLGHRKQTEMNGTKRHGNKQQFILKNLKPVKLKIRMYKAKSD